MTISDIYAQYTIMRSLQLHMFRVASVAQMICEHIDKPIDKKHIISACLLHDMGNILKFDLSVFPEFLQPEGFDYWKNIQDEYRNKYGNDEHAATIAIAKELNVSERTAELIDAIGFSMAPENFQQDDFSRKICMYADTRVQPHGVTDLRSRLEDGTKRFNAKNPDKRNDTYFAEMSRCVEKIEEQIFQHSSLLPKDITDESIQTFIFPLANFNIQ